jgi:hypothetical protein
MVLLRCQMHIDDGLRVWVCLWVVVAMACWCARDKMQLGDLVPS